MVLDIQTVHHILKNTAVQNVNKRLHYGLDFHFNYCDEICDLLEKIL
jgi:hypothetical protein